MIARSSVIPSVISQTNRDEWTVLNATNFSVRTPQGDRGARFRILRRALAAQLRRGLDLFRCPNRPDRGVGGSPAHRTDGCLTGRAGRGGRSGGPGGSTGRHAQRGAGIDSSGRPGRVLLGLPRRSDRPAQLAHAGTDADGVGCHRTAEGDAQAPMQAIQGVTSLPQSMMQAFGGMFPSTGCAQCRGGGLRRRFGTRAGRWRGIARWRGGAGGFPGAGLTSYTRPTSSFEPQAGGGRPACARRAQRRRSTRPDGAPGVPRFHDAGGDAGAGSDAEGQDVARVRSSSTASRSRSRTRDVGFTFGLRPADAPHARGVRFRSRALTRFIARGRARWPRLSRADALIARGRADPRRPGRSPASAARPPPPPSHPARAVPAVA